jgi:hypothetical protein
MAMSYQGNLIEGLGASQAFGILFLNKAEYRQQVINYIIQ